MLLPTQPVSSIRVAMYVPLLAHLVRVALDDGQPGYALVQQDVEAVDQRRVREHLCCIYYFHINYRYLELFLTRPPFSPSIEQSVNNGGYWNFRNCIPRREPWRVLVVSPPLPYSSSLLLSTHHSYALPRAHTQLLRRADVVLRLRELLTLQSRLSSFCHYQSDD